MIHFLKVSASPDTFDTLTPIGVSLIDIDTFLEVSPLHYKGARRWRVVHLCPTDWLDLS